MSKLNVWLAQVNNTYGRNAFLPYSVGLIQAYCQQDPEIQANYDFRGFVYLREDIDQAVARMGAVDVVGVSCYIWNNEYSLALARAVKQANPNCLVVLGGPHVPLRSENYFAEHPFADLLVHYEGELAFADILRERLKPEPDYATIAGLSVKRTGNSCLKTAARDRIGDLSVMPSPYLTGVFDQIVNDPYEWNALQETNRGCPYSCLVADTMVTTPRGDCRLIDTRPGDLVMGWNGQQAAWNEVRMLLHPGVRDVYEVTIGGKSIRATADHPIYTRYGKRSIGQLKVGDQILVQDLSKAMSGRSGDVFAEVRSNCTEELADKATEDDQAILQGLRMPTQAETDQVRLLAIRQHMLKRLCCRGDSSWQARRCQSHEAGGDTGEGQPSTEATLHWNQQPAAKETPCRGSSAVRSDNRRRSAGDCRAYARAQPHEKPKDCEARAEQAKKALRQSGVPSRMARKATGTSEQVREASGSLAVGASPAVSLHGGLQVLDRSVHIGFVPKSGLHPHGQKEEGDSGTWAILAPVAASSRGAARLRRCGMAVFYHLGGRAARCEDAATTDQVRIGLACVESVRYIGRRPVYDIDASPTHNFFADGILVGNCTMCDWGSSVMAKVRAFPTERLVEEFKWFAEHRAVVAYNCDANFAILPRDAELIDRLVDIKAATGYPERFRAAYAKNSNEAVFNIARKLHRANMNKGVTLSFQSMNDKTLVLIKRKNIKIDNFANLIGRYRAEGIATYSELIIGLPGETYDTFADGLDLLVQSGQHDSLQCYSCEVLPNSEMNEPKYLAMHGIRSVRTPVLVFHGTPNTASDPHCEYYEIVVETAVLPPDDWMKTQMLAWAFQAFHCLGLLQCVALHCRHHHQMSYREFYELVLAYAAAKPASVVGRAAARARQCFEDLRSGKPWGFVNQRFGDIIWPPEEAGFLVCVVELSCFLLEIQLMLRDQLDKLDDQLLLSSVMAYQQAVVWAPWQEEEQTVRVSHNVHERLEAAYRGETVASVEGEFGYLVRSLKCYDDLETYAREIVWYGRKGGRFRHTDVTLHSPVVVQDVVGVPVVNDSDALEEAGLPALSAP